MGDARNDPEGDGGDLFSEAMRDVEPLDGPRTVPRRRRPERTFNSATAGRRAPRFQVERQGGRVRGLAEGRRPRLLNRLRGGAFPVEHRVDLHGFTETEARMAVRDEVEEAWRRGRRCLLVIHGRGRHSPGGPVLREALPDWLVDPPLSHRVIAFVTAPERYGGTGATLVLLKVRRGGG